MINKDNLQEDILDFILFARFLMLSKSTFIWRIVYLVHHIRRVVLTASLSPLPWAKQFCSNPAHDEVYLKQHYVIKFVSELRQDDVFFPGKPVFSTNKTDRHDITEIFLKVVLKTITRTLLLQYLYSICVRGIDLPISTFFFYQILELFWHRGIFCFSFFLITIYILSIPKNNNHIYLLYHELHFNC